MAKLEWDKLTERYFETGIEKCAMYPQVSGAYPKGHAWNGMSSISESPSGAESTPVYADNTKYLNLMSAEELGLTIEAYTYPKEFEQCDGSASLATGVNIGQQTRKAFGLSYKTLIGNDEDGIDHGYKIHLIYGIMASPSERSYSTVNDSPEASTMSWECTTTPVVTTGFKPTSIVTIDSTAADPEKLAAFEKIIWGDTEAEARLPLPDEVKTLLTAGV